MAAGWSEAALAEGQSSVPAAPKDLYLQLQETCYPFLDSVDTYMITCKHTHTHTLKNKLNLEKSKVWYTHAMGT